MKHSLACVSSATLLAFSLLIGTPSTAIAAEGVPPLSSDEDAGGSTLIYSDDRTDSATTTDSTSTANNDDGLAARTDDTDPVSKDVNTEPAPEDPDDSSDPVEPEPTEPERIVNTVTKIDGKLYWVGSDGKVLTGKGWHNVSDQWIYSRDATGALSTGWLSERGAWYWLDPETGAMATGWTDADGKRYHFAVSGAMETGWKKLGGTWYHLSSSGAMDTGWKSLGGKWYWLDPKTGGLKTGWLLLDDIWYWQGESGAAQNQIKVINGIGYAFDNSCAWRTVDVSELPKETSMNKKQSALINACYKVPSPGAGFCSEWVSEVFEYTGQKHLYLDACDMANDYCHNSNLSQLKPGMIIAVRTHSHTVPGSIWGHVCIYIGNGKVIENVGSIRTTDLGSWLWWYGVSVTPKWGWYDNKALA